MENKEKHDLEHEFAQSTSCHGFKPAINATNRWLKWFWTVAMLLSFGGLAVQIFQLLNSFLEYDAVTEVKYTTFDRLTFPAVTVCNYNRFRKTALKKAAKRYGLEPNDLWLYLAIMFTSDTGEYQDVEGRQKLIDDVEKKLSMDQKDLVDLIYKVGNSFEDFIIMCSWNGFDNCTGRSDLFETYMTRNGVCFTYNSVINNSTILKKQVAGGLDSGLQMVINVAENEYTEQKILAGIGFTQIGLIVIVHDNFQRPDISRDAVALVRPGIHAYLGISMSKEENTRSPYGNCTSHPLDHSIQYTKHACVRDSNVKTCNEACNCVPIYMNPDLEEIPSCTPRQIVECITPLYYCLLYLTERCNRTMVPKLNTIRANSVGRNSKCGPACHAVNYKLTTSYAFFPNSQFLTEIENGRLDKMANLSVGRDLVSLNVNFDSLDVVTRKQRPGKSYSDLLADIGGQMGLCIGASFLTVAEFVVFFIRKCIHKNKKPGKSTSVEN